MPENRLMATPALAKIERSGPAIRAVLEAHSPHECGEFQAELRRALAEADDDLDLSRVDAVLDRWWGIAHLRANPPTEAERAAIERARSGDFSGLCTRDQRGSWTTL
jgi:hypothetical protein